MLYSLLNLKPLHTFAMLLLFRYELVTSLHMADADLPKSNTTFDIGGSSPVRIENIRFMIYSSLNLDPEAVFIHFIHSRYVDYPDVNSRFRRTGLHAADALNPATQTLNLKP